MKGTANDSLRYAEKTGTVGRVATMAWCSCAYAVPLLGRGTGTVWDHQGSPYKVGPGRFWDRCGTIQVIVLHYAMYFGPRVPVIVQKKQSRKSGKLIEFQFKEG